MALNISTSFSNSIILSSLAFLIFVLIITYYTIKSMKIEMNKGLKLFLLISLVLVGWFGIVFSIGKFDLFSLNPLFIPNLALGFLILFQLLRMVYYSKKIQPVADAISVHWIIGVQTYRVVGVGFLILYAQGILPAAFAFSAGIGDILVGVTAPFVATWYYFRKPYARKLAIMWNIIGILDLVAAIGIGTLGFSRPIQFVPMSPTTEPLSLFPLVLVPLFAVPLAFLLHFFSLRVLRD